MGEDGTIGVELEFGSWTHPTGLPTVNAALVGIHRGNDAEDDD